MTRDLGNPLGANQIASCPPSIDVRRQIQDSGVLKAAQAVEILQNDQLQRWRRGERIPAESYLQILAEQLADGSSLASDECFDLIYGELLLRRELGERPSLGEYLWRFPQFTQKLRLVDQLEGQLDTDLALDSERATVHESGKQRQSAEASRWPIVPGYEILGELGRGGMGVVFRARQTSLQRQVALKMIRAGADADPAALARFRVEAEAVAQLQHPNIVQVYEIGGIDDLSIGCPFMALELVDGGSLAGVVARGEVRGASKEEQRKAAELVATIARAIHYAHQHGILHRDLKPGNILLQKDEGRRMKDEEQRSRREASDHSPFIPYPSSFFLPKITDFGLAKRLEEGPVAQTRTGSLLGTPSYMAPEQAAGLSRDIGVATDVYALGAILYELLTGRPPFKGETPLATLQQVRNLEPEPPSRLQSKLPADLDTICLKCLQKEPAKRYASAAELAEDLERFLAHKPIRARRVGAAGRLARWCRRNPTLTATLTTASIVIAMVASVGLWGVFKERDNYRLERDHAQANLYRALSGEARAQIDARATGWSFRALDNVREATKLDVASRDTGALRDLAIECMGSSFSCFQLQDTWKGHSGAVTALKISPDGQIAATGSRDRTVRLWSMPEGKELAILSGHTGTVYSVAFAPDGRRLASCSADGSVRLWTIGSSAGLRAGAKAPASFPVEVRELKGGRVSSVAIAPDGAWLAAGCQDSTIHVFPLAVESGATTPALFGSNSRENHPTLKGHSGPVNCVIFSPIGELISSSNDNTIRFWDVALGKQTSSWAFGGPIGDLAFPTPPVNEGNKHIVASNPHGVAGSIRRMPVGHDALGWSMVESYSVSTRNRQTGWEPSRYSHGHLGPVMQVCWSSKGTFLSASQDGFLKAWYNRGGVLEELAIAGGDFGAVFSACFDPEGDVVAAGYVDGRVRLWRLSEPTQRALVGGDSQNAVFIGTGRRLVSSASTFDFTEGMRPQKNSYTPSPIRALAVHPGSRHFIFSQGESLHIWDLKNGTEERQWRAHDSEILGLAESPDGKRLASFTADGKVSIWTWETNQLERTLDAGVEKVHALAWSPNSRQLAATGERGAVVWDMDGAVERLRVRHDLSNSAVALGKNLLALTAGEGVVALYDPPTGKLLRTINGHKNQVRSLAFSPDGTLLASGANQEARLWRVPEGTELAVLDAPKELLFTQANWLTFDPLGRYLVFDQVQVWDIHSMKLVAYISSAGSKAPCGKFLPDGSGFLLGTDSGAVQLCTVAEIEKLRNSAGGPWQPVVGPVRVESFSAIVSGGHLGMSYGVAASPDGRWVATACHDQTTKLWDARTMKLVRTLTGHTDLVWGVAFSPDSQILATGSECEPTGDLRLWEVATGRELCRLRGHKRQIVSCAFHQKLPLLATSAIDGSVWLWDLAARKPLGLLHQFDQPVYSLAFRPDGRWLAAACYDNRVALWNVEQTPTTPTAPERYLTGHTGAVWSVGFNADGTTLASGSEQGVIILWNGQTFERMATLRGGTQQIRGLSFSHDGQLLAGASYFAQTIVWDLAGIRRSLREMNLLGEEDRW